MYPSAFTLMQTLNDAAVAAREEHNLARKAVFDNAVKLVAIRSAGLPLEDVCERVRGTLDRAAHNRFESATQRGYYQDAVAVVDEFTERLAA